MKKKAKNYVHDKKKLKIKIKDSGHNKLGNKKLFSY
jgi:hypothetical protein